MKVCPTGQNVIGIFHITRTTFSLPSTLYLACYWSFFEARSSNSNPMSYLTTSRRQTDGLMKLNHNLGLYPGRGSLVWQGISFVPAKMHVNFYCSKQLACLTPSSWHVFSLEFRLFGIKHPTAQWQLSRGLLRKLSRVTVQESLAVTLAPPELGERPLCSGQLHWAKPSQFPCTHTYSQTRFPYQFNTRFLIAESRMSWSLK